MNKQRFDYSSCPYRADGPTLYAIRTVLPRKLAKLPVCKKSRLILWIVPDHGRAWLERGLDGPLASFLTSKKAASSQRRKFLATSVWLHDSTGKPRLSTGDVKKALKTNNQGKLANASASLNDNVAKGFCEKDGKNGFFVTDPGRAEIG